MGLLGNYFYFVLFPFKASFDYEKEVTFVPVNTKK